MLPTRSHLTGLLAALLAPAFAFAGALTPCEAVSGNLVQNCGFEVGDFTNWTQSGNTDSTAVYESFDGFLPNSGAKFASLGPSGTNGFLSQTFATTPGNSYTISWYLATDAGTPNEFNATWDGASILAAADLDVVDYVLYTFTHLATTGSTTLSFNFRDEPGYLALDDVSVVETPTETTTTPEPGTLTLLAITAAATRLRRSSTSPRPKSC